NLKWIFHLFGMCQPHDILNTTLYDPHTILHYSKKGG
ncbi:hypothetical protein OKW22_001388, partial [Bacilli bacterium PM5-3]|nr:hypothetical protein [Bacilli bacterium PM5-3]